LIIERVEPLGRPEDIALRGSLLVQLGADPPIDQIQEVLERHSGEAMVRFVYQDPDGKQRVIRGAPEWGVRPSSNLVSELEQLLGSGSASLVMEKRAQVAQKPAWARS
jgi:hypothetical protein